MVKDARKPNCATTENLQTLQELRRAMCNKCPWKKTIILLDDSARLNAVRLCTNRIWMKPWNLSTIHPTGLTRPSSCSLFWFVKDQMRGHTMENELLKRGSVGKGMFRHLEWWQILIDWDYGICREVNAVRRINWHAVFTCSYLYLTQKN